MPHLLVVEDDRDLLGELRELLEGQGYRVDAAGNGAQAFARLSAGLRPDAIVLDLLMPVMDGWELLCRLEERDDLRGVPVLVMSAAAHMAAPRVGVRYIPKPLCIETLLAQVAGMIVGDAAVAGQRSPVPALQAGEAGGTEDSAAA